MSPTGLRAAVIGLGRMGVRHIEALGKLGMTVCGGADLAEQSIESARRSQNLPSSACFTDAHEMLRSMRPEAVVVATTAPSHAELVVAAARGGAKYILCEKPMAISLAEADVMIEACRESGATLAVNHQMQFMPHYARVKALIDTDELGPLARVLVAGSNFGLAMNASHYFEMFRYLSGAPVRSVRAWFEDAQLANPRGPQFEDKSGRLLAQGAANASMYIDFSADCGHGLQVVYICRFGQIVVDELSGDLRITARKREFRDLPTTRYGMPADVHQEKIEPADTVLPTMGVWSAMLAGKPFPDGAAGAHALACCVAAHVSHEAGGREVRLDDPGLPHARRFKWA